MFIGPKHRNLLDLAWTAGAPVSPYEVPFGRIPIPALTPFGTPYTRWVPSGMPKLGQYTPILKAVPFLYPDTASALNGVQAGGTGFLVGVLMTHFPEFMHVHVVTNYHVAVFNENAPPNPVVRVNKIAGGADAFEFDPSEWVFRPGGPDVAISPPLNLNNRIHDYKNFDPGWFVNKENEVTDEIGPGEDVFMIGRFVDFDGVDTNAPAARFGHISMMDARIEQSTGYKGRSIVLDMHSRSGFSGSPVIVYRTLGSHFLEHKPDTIITGAGHYIKLLGIHYAQFPEAWELKEKKKPSLMSQAALVADSHYIEGLSGMTCVVPASDILSLLDDPQLKAMRQHREITLMRTTAPPASAPKPEAAPVPLDQAATDENPQHREDFTSLLGKAARTPPQDG